MSVNLLLRVEKEPFWITVLQLDWHVRRYPLILCLSECQINHRWRSKLKRVTLMSSHYMYYIYIYTHVYIINKLSRKNEKPTKGQSQENTSISRGWRTRACVEDQGGSSNQYRFIRNLDRGVIWQFEIKTVSEKSMLLCQFICNF